VGRRGGVGRAGRRVGLGGEFLPVDGGGADGWGVAGADVDVDGGGRHPYVEWLSATSAQTELADVLQPFLRPIVDLGYGSPFAIPGIIPSLSPFTFAGSLGQSAAFGIASPLVAGLSSASSRS
jgi:hypothetical protein